MCGLYGFLRYGKGKLNTNELTECLAIESAARGTDATGVAYNEGLKMHVYKKPSSAYRMNFKFPDVKALIGHTRHATQGNVRNNQNNHPFMGRTNKSEFALAHNGVLLNDTILRESLHLPKTKIETDSYIAVQLIESQRVLNMRSIAYMAEKIQGSFSFSILDKYNNIYLVKGDSPLYILHFPKRQLYVYASTSAILWKALVDTELFIDLKNNEYEEIKISEGEILKIRNNGMLRRGKFTYDNFMDYRCDWRSYGTSSYSDSQMYIDDLKFIAAYQGYSSDDIDELVKNGFSPEEIEEYIYCMDGEV